MDPISSLLHVVNVLLVLALLCVYYQNYRHLKTKYTIGLIFFAVLFLIQSSMGIYFEITMVMYSSYQAEVAATLVEAVKVIGFAILLWISWE